MAHMDQSGTEAQFTRDVRDFGMRARHYLRTRTLEHYLILACGVIVGMMIG